MQKREREIVELDDKVQKLERDKEERVSYSYTYTISNTASYIATYHVWESLEG